MSRDINQNVDPLFIFEMPDDDILANTISVRGEKGATGDVGPSNTITIGTVTGGDTASATMTGTSPNQVLNLVLPKGDKGDTGTTGSPGPSNTITIGTVTGGDTASATMTGTSPNQVLNLVLPKGDKGDPYAEKPTPYLNATGDDLQLNESGDGIKSINKILGATNQDGTPSTASPIDITTVSGENTISITGKNLLKINDGSSTNNGVTLTRTGGTIHISGTATAWTQYWYMNYNISFATPVIMKVFSEGSYSGISVRLTVKRNGSLIYVECGNNNTFKFQAGDVLKQIYFIITNGSVVNATLRMQIEKGNTASDFEPFTGRDYPLSLGSLELCKIGDHRDYIYKSNETWYKHAEIAKIDSYNGETITTDYISTTGELSTGATVYYVLGVYAEQAISDSTLVSQLNKLDTATIYEGVTNIAIAPAQLKPTLDLNYWTWYKGERADITVDDLENYYTKSEAVASFNTVADMKAYALGVGDYAVTHGFYTVGDGGGANYQIVSSSGITVDGARYITLDNGLVAKLLIVGEANVKQFGATGDGTTDDTNAIKSAIQHSNSIFMPSGSYVVTDTISFENKNLRGAQATHTSLRGLMDDKTKPVLAIGGMSNVESITVSIVTSSLTGTVNATNNIGILLYGGYRNLPLQNGSLRNVQVANCYNGITDGGSSVFSCVFENVRIQDFYCRGMSMTGSARTGNVYSNIYIHNHGFIETNHADTVTAWSGFYMAGEESECTISQLNVEHLTAYEPIYLENVHGLAATSIHLEGVRNASSYHGFVCLSKVYGVIDAISFYFTRHRIGQSLIWLGDANDTDTEHNLFGGAKQLTINLLECKGLNRPDRATYGYEPEYPVTDSTLASESITGFNFITRESANDKYNVGLVSYNWQTYNYGYDDSSVYKAFPKNPHGSINWLKCGTKPLFGTTNERPTEMLYYGLTYFDTTLNKQITYYNGKWYDANGYEM